MKKLLLGLFLLSALVVVSYLKTVRESEREAEAFIEGHDLGARKADLIVTNTDSLENLIEERATALVELRSTMSDTLTERDEQFARTIDSLSGIIRSGQAEIAGLEKEVAASKQADKASSAQPKATASKASHKDILKHYQLTVAKLPADLSAYEYRVAVAEVRSDTAAKFKITVARLNEIREANNLDY